MAVSAHVYPSALERLLKATIDLDTHTIKIALLDGDAAFDATDNEFADVSGDEIPSADGYIAGGATLASAAVAVTDGVAAVDFANAAWPESTIATSNAVIYDDTVAGDPLIAFIDFDGEITSVAGTFTVAFDADGVLSLAEAA